MFRRSSHNFASLYKFATKCHISTSNAFTENSPSGIVQLSTLLLDIWTAITFTNSWLALNAYWLSAWYDIGLKSFLAYTFSSGESAFKNHGGSFSHATNLCFFQVATSMRLQTLQYQWRYPSPALSSCRLIPSFLYVAYWQPAFTCDTACTTLLLRELQTV